MFPLRGHNLGEPPCHVLGNSRGDKTPLELFRQGVSTVSWQLSIAGTALTALLALSCPEQASPK